MGSFDESPHGASLVVAPEASFDRIDRTLRELGYVRDHLQTVGAALLPGEPELARWRWRGERPHVTYTFNPAVALRVLDVDDLSPSARADIASRIGCVSAAEIAEWLAAPSPRRRLLGVFAARELALGELVATLESLADDEERAVANAARDAASAIRAQANARFH